MDRAKIDEIKARVDGGIRVYAFDAIDTESVQALDHDETAKLYNATLILDEGIEL